MAKLHRDANAPAGISFDVSNMQAQLTVDEAWIDSIGEKVFDSEGISCAKISVGLTDNASIRVINARYLNHDWPTDVISFPYSESGEAVLMGELVISTEMALETAVATGGEPLDELALYLVHGLLHLCGYDDQTAADASVIRERETAILAALQIDNPFHRAVQNPVMSENSGRESVRWPR